MVFYAFGRRALELVVWGLTSVVLVQSVIAPLMPMVHYFYLLGTPGFLIVQ